MALGDAMYGIRVRFCGKTAFLDFNVIFNVVGFTTSIDCMRLAWAAREAAFLGSCSRSQLNFTAAASYGVPSVNFTLGRRTRVHTNASCDVSDSAVLPFTVPVLG